MPNQLPFDLDKAVTQWRDELARQPGLTPADLRELEAHLRDGFAELCKNPIREEEAFLLARLRVGPPKPVAAEFAKAKLGRTWVPRVFCITFLLVLSSFAAVAIFSKHWYLASATVELVRSNVTAMSSDANQNSPAAFDPSEFNAYLRLMETHDIAQRVAARMSSEERQTFLAPFASANSTSLVDRLLLQRNHLLLQRSVWPRRTATTLAVSVEHPNPHIAAIVADDFAQVYIDAQKTNPRIMANGESFEWMDHASGHVNMSKPKVTLLLIRGGITALMAGFVAAALVRLLGRPRHRFPPTKLAS